MDQNLGSFVDGIFWRMSAAIFFVGSFFLLPVRQTTHPCPANAMQV
jgi:hypothetical protein